MGIVPKYLYQTFNLRMQLISIFQRLSQIFRGFVWKALGLDLTYKLVELKIKSEAPDQIYFVSQVFQEHSHCYDKRKKIRK